MEIKPYQVVEFPNAILEVLREFIDVMPSKFSKKLHPQWPTDHQIKLVFRVKPPTQISYLSTPPKLVELRKQIIKLLDVGAKNYGLLRSVSLNLVGCMHLS